jgi:starvation-inducible DNA-binding protein
LPRSCDQQPELYDQVAEGVLEYVDMIAERATALGGLALGTARMAAAASTLDEYPLDAVEGMETVRVIAERLAAYGASVRKAIDDALELKRPGHCRSLHRGLTRDRQAHLQA